MTEEVQTIVIDNGSSLCKAGFGGEEVPHSVFPSIVGRKKYIAHYTNQGKDHYIGEEVCDRPGVFSLTYPIERGVIKNFDDMEKIWHYTFFNELRVDPAEHPVLLTEATKIPKINREKMIQIMFETFNVPSFYVGYQSRLSIYASGRKTGIVLDVGDGVSQIVPIWDDYHILHAIIKTNFGGCDLTAWLQKLLEERDCKVNAFTGMKIKEKHCYVALDYDTELQKATNSTEFNVSYNLPDGQTITIGSERFRCPELLFNPYMNGFDFDGIDQNLFDSINKCDEDIRRDLYANIVLSGGTTMLEGLPERIEKKIIDLAPPTMKIKVVAPPERKYAVWIGGSILASLSTFPQMVITHDEYNDSGVGIVHRKCF